MSITLQEIIEVDTSSVPAPAPASTSNNENNNYRTIIKHGEHMGWLKDGKLFCQNGSSEELKKEKGCVECSLEFDENLKCEVVNDNHIHGPNCGHEKVPHADHYDYLVGTRLHHVVSNPSSCCNRQCLGQVKPETIVDHGHVDVIRKQKINDSDFLIETFDFSESVTTNIYVNGICCPSETPIIQKIVKSLPGVEAVNVNVVTKNVKIIHDPSKTAPIVFVSALNAAGLGATIGNNMSMKGTYASHFPWKLLLCGIFLLVSFCQYISNGVESLKYLALLGVAIGIHTLLLRAYNSIKRMMLDINVLMTIAVTGAIALGDYTEAAAVVFLFGLSEWLEDKCMKYARGTINGLMEMQPAYATSAKDNKAIPVEHIKIGDILVVRPGDRMPVNGIIISGSSLVDESLLTGESKSILKNVDDMVISGSLNSGKSSLVIKATHLTSESMIARLATLVEDAATQKSSTDRVIEKFAKIYTPTVVIIAVLLALMPFTHVIDNHAQWAKLSLVLLITACPCALVISTPVAVFCGISKAAQKSVLIKGGKYLETLSNLKVLTFDKTGTLTEGSFKVVDIKCLSEIDENDILAMAASLELHSTHPMAPAILGEAAARNILKKELAVDVKEIPGLGITGKIGEAGEMIAIGNMSLMEMVVGNLNSDIVHKSFNINQYRSDEKVCYICNQSRVIGVFLLSDAVRYQAKSTVSKLKKMNMTLAMLTGDDRIVSESVAMALGIELKNVHANLLPSDKLDIMQKYRKEFGSVAHVGDGANDSPALVAADLGIAMGTSGTALTIESADITLFTNDLSRIIDAINISKKVKWKIIENIVLAIIIKLLVFSFIIVGSVSLWHAVLADVGSSLLVTLNGLSVLFTDKNFFTDILNFFKNRQHQNFNDQDIECYSKRRLAYQQKQFSHESNPINKDVELGEISCFQSKKSCCKH